MGKEMLPHPPEASGGGGQAPLQIVCGGNMALSRGSSLSVLLSQGRCGPVFEAQTDPVSFLGSICLWGDVRERAFGPPVGKPTLKRRRASVLGNFDRRGRWFHDGVLGARGDIVPPLVVLGLSRSLRPTCREPSLRRAVPFGGNS